MTKTSNTSTHYPTEMKTGLVKNPGMGWVLYLDAFHQMVDDDFPDINKGVYDAELFWSAFDNAGATEKASIFYIRAPWSYFEPKEGEYAWKYDNNYKKLIDHALENDINLSFRVVMDSQDGYQQGTPEYVREAGAKGYINTFWNPYINDEIFLEKFTKFIDAFGKKYNDPSKVDFIDAMGMGAWGEGHNIQSDDSQPGDVNTSVEIVANAYRAAFDKVLLGAQQGGALLEQAEVLVVSNKYDILRRDSFGMPRYLPQEDIEYYVSKLQNDGIPLFAENGWNYFAHDYEEYKMEYDCPYSNIRDMLEATLKDALEARANTFDFRVPEDAKEWMKNEDLVDEFIDKGGYRFVPQSLTVPTIIDSYDHLIVESKWENKGIGKIPNDRPAWNYKYKVAYSLLDLETESPVFTHVTDIDPSEWLMGYQYRYESNISFVDIPNGAYDFAYAIVDTTKGNKPAINLAITNVKTKSGWYKIGQTTVCH